MAGPVPVPPGGPVPGPSGAGGFSVRPFDVWTASQGMADGQHSHDRAARKLVSGLAGSEQIAGNGDGPGAFADAYKEVANLFLDAWAASVVGIGGAAVGLTVTANAYVKADALSTPSGAPPSTQAPPHVIEHRPDYGPAPDIRWRGTDQDSHSAVVRMLGHIPDFLSEDIVGPAVDEGLRLGNMYRIAPGASSFPAWPGVIRAWHEAAGAVLETADSLNSVVDRITDDGNGEWQTAMRSFCQTLWGTSAYGRMAHGRDWKTNATVDPASRRPVIEVLHHTATEIAAACGELVQANKGQTAIQEAAGKKALDAVMAQAKSVLESFAEFRNPFAAVASLSMIFAKNMDESGVNKGIDEFQETCRGLAKRLKELVPALHEAILSAPTFTSEDARAEGYGMRSLNDFRKPRTSGGNSLSLAALEGVDGAHTLDRHVGKTDDQLAQRLRDDQKKGPTQANPYGKPKIGNASTFSTIESAQENTAYCLKDNADEIDQWINKKPPRGRLDVFASSTPYGPTGRAISKADFMRSGMNAKAGQTRGVEARLEFDADLQPPYVVVTAMPVDKPLGGGDDQ